VPRRPEADDFYGDGRDAPTQLVVDTVLDRQRRTCIARLLDDLSDECAGRLQLDHVKSQPHVGAPVEKRGKRRRHRYRAPSDPAHLVAVCAHHHLDGWATSHRGAIRDWLSR